MPRQKRIRRGWWANHIPERHETTFLPSQGWNLTRPSARCLGTLGTSRIKHRSPSVLLVLLALTTAADSLPRWRSAFPIESSCIRAQGCSIPCSLYTVRTHLQPHRPHLPTTFSLCTLSSLAFHWECPIRLPFDPCLVAEMAGYTSAGRKLAIVLATIVVPLVAVILYQAVDPTWYATYLFHVLSTPRASGRFKYGPHHVIGSRCQQFSLWLR